MVIGLANGSLVIIDADTMNSEDIQFQTLQVARNKPVRCLYQETKHRNKLIVSCGSEVYQLTLSTPLKLSFLLDTKLDR